MYHVMDFFAVLRSISLIVSYLDLFLLLFRIQVPD